MKFETDLNDLTDSQLEFLISLSNQGKIVRLDSEKQPITKRQMLIAELMDTKPEIETEKPKQKKTRKITPVLNQQIAETIDYIAKRKKFISLSRAFKKITGYYPTGKVSSILKTKLLIDERIENKNKYFRGKNKWSKKPVKTKTEKVYKPKSKKVFSERSHYIFSKGNTYMKKFNMTRKNAFSKAAKEWDSIKKPDLFDWNLLIGRNGKELRESFIHAFTNKKKVSFNDVSHLLENSVEYLLFCQRVIQCSVQIRKDVGIEQNIVYDGNSITFK